MDDAEGVEDVPSSIVDSVPASGTVADESKIQPEGPYTDVDAPIP